MGHLGRMLLEILHMFVEGFWVEKVYHHRWKVGGWTWGVWCLMEVKKERLSCATRCMLGMKALRP